MNQESINEIEQSLSKLKPTTSKIVSRKKTEFETIYSERDPRQQRSSVDFRWINQDASGQSTLSVFKSKNQDGSIDQKLSIEFKQKFQKRERSQMNYLQMSKLSVVSRQKIEPKDRQVESQISKRQEALRSRPILPKLRATSAKQKNKIFESNIKAKGMVKEFNQSDSNSQDSTKKATEITDSVVADETTQKFKNTLHQSNIPRLTQISHKDSTLNFKQVLGQQKQNFQTTLGHQKFAILLKNSECQDDREIINMAYEHYMKSINEPAAVMDFNSTKELTLSKSSSNESLILEEDGGPEIQAVQLQDEKLLGRFVEALMKKLAKYKAQLSKELENKAYIPLIENLDITKVQWELDTDKRKQLKRQQIDGEDLQLSALEKIYFAKAKFDRLIPNTKIQIDRYKALLEDECKQSSDSIKLLAEPVNKQCRRGFIILPNQNNFNKVNIEEMIDDPSLVFDRYVYKRQLIKKNVGTEFVERLEFARLSGTYNFNSTIYSLIPTATVALIKSSNFHAELALPILAKIKNKELILTDYRLEIGHFSALGAAFMIDPFLLTKITLNNCGIDDQSFIYLMDCLSKLNRVFHIQITKGRFGVEGVKLLRPFIQKSLSLESLILKDVELLPVAGAEFCQMLSDKSYLKVLNIINFTFTDSAFKYFVSYVELNQHLIDLSIQNAKGLRVNEWVPFFEVLAHNKTLQSIDLSNINFIENQRQALVKLHNPYRVFKLMYDKWVKAGAGARWPANPLEKEGTILKMLQSSPKKGAANNVGGVSIVTVPNFKPVPDIEVFDEQYANLHLTEEENEDERTQKQNQICIKMMSQSLKFAIAIAFMKKNKNKLKQGEQAQKEREVKRKLLEDEEKEFVSQQSMVITEALYKFIRRNQVLQHVDLSRCNLSQVMIGRIGLGVKCSKSMMSIHFSDNPGVNSIVKAFLQVKFKAQIPKEDESKITNAFVEEGANLSENLSQQIKNLHGDSSLAHETIVMKDINKKLFDGSHIAEDKNSLRQTTLMFTRLIGHKLTIPGSGRWQILTKPQHECWICKKYNIQYIFWSPKQIAHQEVHPSLGINKQRVVDKIKTQSLLSQEINVPFIFGKFTNWLPKRMLNVKEFAELPRTGEPPNYINLIKKKYDLGPGTQQIIDLTLQHQIELKKLKFEYVNDIEVNWKKYFGALIRWKDPQLTNFEFLNPETFKSEDEGLAFNNLQDNPIYVYATLTKPGKQYYTVQYNEELSKETYCTTSSSDESSSSDLSLKSNSFLRQHPEDMQDVLTNLQVRPQLERQEPKYQQPTLPTYIELPSDQIKIRPSQKSLSIKKSSNFRINEVFYLHKMIVPIREEILPRITKNTLQQEIEREFEHHSSVFKDWKPDKPAILKKCVATDWLAMNISKLAKTETDQVNLQNVITQHMSFIKNLHLDLLSESSIPPYCSELDFINFYRQCKMSDESLKASSIDLIYVQVCTNDKTRLGINRGEFVECLIRVSKQKYMDTGVCKTLHESFQKLLELILINWGDSNPYAERRKIFWTVEVNDNLHANLDGLMKIFSSFLDLKAVHKKKWMELKDAEYLLTQGMPDLKVNVKDARKCYTMSKMTCDDEQKKIEKYNQLLFVEFLEMLCRIAFVTLDNPMYIDWPFIKKLQYVIEQMLAIKGIERKEVIVQTEIDSDADVSDADY